MGPLRRGSSQITLRTCFLDIIPWRRLHWLLVSFLAHTEHFPISVPQSAHTCYQSHRREVGRLGYLLVYLVLFSRHSELFVESRKFSRPTCISRSVTPLTFRHHLWTSEIYA